MQLSLGVGGGGGCMYTPWICEGCDYGDIPGENCEYRDIIEEGHEYPDKPNVLENIRNLEKAVNTGIYLGF